MKSTHRSEVVPVVLQKHPNADSLSIVKVWGYTCIVRTVDWQGRSRGVYIVPDSCVDVRRPEFCFLADKAKEDGTYRVRVTRLRGELSYGLLIPAPDWAELGQDLAPYLGVTRYEPPEHSRGFIASGEEEEGPDLCTGPEKYDVEAFERYHHLLEVNEPVVVLEKLDGTNMRAVYWEGRYWVKTRNRWVKRVPTYSHITLDSLIGRGVAEEQAREIVERIANRCPKLNSHWEALENSPATMKFLKENPGMTLYGEVFGATNRIRYWKHGKNRLAVFDIYDQGVFLNAGNTWRLGVANDLEMVPAFTPFAGGRTSFAFHGTPYKFDTIKRLATGTTLVEGAGCAVIREGVVVRPLQERYDPKIGRVILKCVSPDFLVKD
jgi:RNA ligase (TIGR02306 family)